MPKANIRTYLKMLTYKRPHGSYEEQEFLFDFIDKLPGIAEDAYGNRIVKIGDNPVTCFSAHVDTVHRTSGKQKVLVDENKMVAYKGDKECLGADDASGCLVLMKLIQSKVPGLYIFHRAEEVGGRGSAFIKTKTPELLKGIKHCIAFDRRDTKSIITFQRSIRCCSQEFVDALAKQFKASEHEMEFVADDGGSFTDSANYTHLVPECTNISIGYDCEHTASESQDLLHLQKMLDVLPTLDWASLPATRDVTKQERKQYNYGGWRGNQGWDDWGDSWDYRNRGQQQPKKYQTSGRKPGALFTSTFTYDPKTKKMVEDSLKWHQIIQFVRAHPQIAADILDDFELAPSDVEWYINNGRSNFGAGV